MKRIRILIAEANPVAREGMRAILQLIPDIELVENAAGSQQIMRLARKCQPDVLLLDLKTPAAQPDGLAAISQHHPKIRALAMSDAWDGVCVRDLVAAGVRGYVDKSEPPEKIIAAIRAVAEGGIWFSRAALQQLIEPSDEPVPAEDFGLADRELIILRSIVAGKTNQNIALALEVSEKTVEKHLAKLYEKLGVGSRVETAVWSVRNDLA
ncbi:MAG: response regulator transcription factor [Anaerolineales bacterium]|nr:response regulator transcription factor [Anaerolineales bacterium]